MASESINSRSSGCSFTTELRWVAMATKVQRCLTPVDRHEQQVSPERMSAHRLLCIDYPYRCFMPLLVSRPPLDIDGANEPIVGKAPTTKFPLCNQLRRTSGERACGSAGRSSSYVGTNVAGRRRSASKRSAYNASMCEGGEVAEGDGQQGGKMTGRVITRAVFGSTPYRQVADRERPPEG